VAVTVHLQTLFWLNPDEPFYAVAAVMSVVATVPVLNGTRVRLVYSGLVLSISAAQLLTGGEGTGFLGVGLAWMFLLLGRQTTTRERAVQQLRETRTELEQERSERQRLEQELQTAQRMDSLGRMAGAFAHEFNNQLMAIRLHADLLERSLVPGVRQFTDVRQIQRTTSAAADLTSRLLAFSRPSRRREDPADLNAVVRQSFVTLRHLMGERIAVVIEPDHIASLFVPIGDKQLSQVLLNFALNSRDAMPDGGSFRVSASRIERASVELPVNLPGDEIARLTVSDSGIGMTDEVRDRLFEPFFTTKADRGNSGLGLSVVYGMVKDSGGHVRVTSNPGAGARFDVYWPLATPAPAGAKATAAPATPRRARVLLVEDQAVLRDGLARWLAERGYAVVPCESAEEALTRANEIDVMASDVVLRGMDGIELLGELRRRTPRLPAVLFSGHVDHLAKRRREIPEGVEFLEKPFALETLAAALEALVDKNALRSSSIH
jgi:signal transduction histidine kinase/CheY-like chemotaxis protein